MSLLNLRRRLGPLLISALGALALGAFGVSGILRPKLVGALDRASFDIPFQWRADQPAPELCLIYLDDKSAAALAQKDVWSRALHTKLIRRLQRDGARAVLFDIVFSGASEDPQIDRDFAAALQEHGHVFLGGALDLHDEGGVHERRMEPPLPLLRKAAAGWGLLVFHPIDEDQGVRRLYTGEENKASATWVMAEALGARLPAAPEERAQPRWLNYYGKPGSFANVSYAAAVSESDVSPGFFRGRLVVVGGRSQMGSLRLGKDEFVTPYTRRGDARFMPGVDLHATALLNLLHGEWLTRVPWQQEVALVVGVALVGGLCVLLRPLPAAGVALLGAAGITIAAFYLHWERHLWFDWLIPVAVQIPLGYAWSLGANYYFEERRRLALRRAFSHYLSPAMAKNIADSQFDLKPGGQMVEATVMFTDLQGFTAISEVLDSPEKLSKMLVDYFTLTTRHVLENDGTIIKFIGDAVMAVWGAPMPDKEHAAKAARAAQALSGATELQVAGQTLITRIGFHTGQVLSGNLGSAIRFDYTCIGDPVNLASRLEGLNKYLGTRVLFSEDTRAQMPETVPARYLGAFCVAGKTKSIGLYELLRAEIDTAAPWLAHFQLALGQYQRGELEEAAETFRQVIDLRGEADGPSRFYLEYIAKLPLESLAGEWKGEVILDAK